MSSAPSTRPTLRWQGAALVALGVVGYATVASGTRPFTLPADVLVGLAGASWAVMLVVGECRSRRLAQVGQEGTWRGSLPWLLLVLLVIAVELFELAHLPRSAHPTISSFLDSFDAERIRRALAWTAWLILGGWLVRR